MEFRRVLFRSDGRADAGAAGEDPELVPVPNHPAQRPDHAADRVAQQGGGFNEAAGRREYEHRRGPDFTALKATGMAFVVALVLRVATLVYLLPQLKPNVDRDSYRALARSLAAGKGYVATGEDGRELPHVGQTPVYPLF